MCLRAQALLSISHGRHAPAFKESSGCAMQARMALQLPWWTLAGGFPGMAALAQLGDSAPEVQAALDRQAASQV